MVAMLIPYNITLAMYVQKNGCCLNQSGISELLLSKLLIGLCNIHNPSAYYNHDERITNNLEVCNYFVIIRRAWGHDMTKSNDIKYNNDIITWERSVH